MIIYKVILYNDLVYRASIEYIYVILNLKTLYYSLVSVDISYIYYIIVKYLFSIYISWLIKRELAPRLETKILFIYSRGWPRAALGALSRVRTYRIGDLGAVL